MWRKTLNKHCTFKTYDCNRIAGLELNCDSFKALFLCVYMPCDSSDNYDDFMLYPGKKYNILTILLSIAFVVIPIYQHLSTLKLCH